MENHGVRYGLMAGVSISIIMLILYFIDGKTMLSYYPLIAWVIFITCMVLAGRDTKRDLEGFMSWGEALKPTWITYLIGSLIMIIFQYVLMNFIDTNLLEIQKELDLERTIKFAEMFGAPEDAIEEMEAAFEEQDVTAGYSSPMMIVFGWGIGLIFPGFLFAAIISIFVRKNRPAGA